MDFAFNFKKVAQQNVTLCPLMAGRQKLETLDVINKDLTIVAFDFAPKFDQAGNPVIDENGETDTFGVVVFEEMPDRYYSVGVVFTKVCKAWVQAFNDAEEASAALKESGGVRVKFSRSNTKRGQNLTTVEILD